MKNRSANADFARFIAALLIMAHHIYNTGVDEYPFHEAWIYVEFFLLMAGYYTAVHFSKETVTNRTREAFRYTIKKFMPLFPYALIVTLCGWITQGIEGILYMGWTWRNFVSSLLGDFAFDILLLTDSFSHPLILPLWYLSSMLIVFPFFCLIVLIRNRYTKVLVCFICPLLYYGWKGVVGDSPFPHNLFRVSAGMMLGLLLYEISVIFGEYIQKIPKTVITIIEIAAFAYPLYGCCRNFAEKGYTTPRLYLLCFFINLLLCLPGFSHTVNIKGRFFNYPARLSVPMFILHWYVGTLVRMIGDEHGLGGNVRIAVYYAATLGVSAALMAVIDHLGKWNLLLKKDFEFPD